MGNDKDSPLSSPNILKPLLVLLFLLAYPLLLIWQGIDITDMGNSITNHARVLSDPASVKFSSAVWLTNVLGGLWLRAFGSLGALAPRLAAVCTYYAIVILIYVMLKHYMDEWHLIMGICFATIVALTSPVTWLNYDKLTALFYVMASFFLVRGLVHQKVFLIAVSAALLAANTFIRLPNILGASLFIAIVYWKLVNPQYSRTTRDLVAFFVSLLASHCMILLIMYYSGHLQVVLDHFHEMASAASFEAHPHALAPLAALFVRDHVFAVAFATIAIVAIPPASRVISLLPPPIRATTILLAATGTGYALSLFTVWKWILTGMIYAILLFQLLGMAERKRELRLVALIALGVLVLVPIGSNTGLYKAPYGMWIAIPLTTHYILGLRSLRTPLTSCTASELRPAKVILALSTLVFAGILTFASPARDARNRFRLLTPIQHRKLRGILTTQERARSLQELLTALDQYVFPGDALLAFQHIPIVHFLTDTKPYLNNAWPIQYTPQSLRMAIDLAMKQYPQLPVAVRARHSTCDRDWPSSHSDWPLNPVLQRENSSTLDKFLISNGYDIVWQNDFFDILVPKGRSVPIHRSRVIDRSHPCDSKQDKQSY